MDTVYATAVAFAAPVFLLAIAAEVLVDRARGTRYYNLADAVTSVGCGTAFIGARISFGFIGLVTYQWTLDRLAPIRLPADHWGTWAFAFVLYDFCYYWWHRLSHEIALLWGTHVVHHQSEEFNLSTALRQPSAAFLTGWMFYLPLALCGVPLTVYLGVGIAQLLYQFWPHTRHIGKLAALDRWIQTPSNHRVHHAKNAAYIDKNYVGVFMIWDRMFGTFEDEHDDDPCVYGITENIAAWNPAWANVHFYWSLATDSWRTRSWSDKLRVWFARPGWRPPDLAGTPRRSPIRTDARPSKAAAWYALVQFASVIALNQYFLLNFTRHTALQNALCFAVIFAGLTTASIVLAVRREFYPLEICRLAAISALVYVWNPAATPILLAFTAASAAWFVTIWSKSANPRACTAAAHAAK